MLINSRKSQLLVVAACAACAALVCWRVNSYLLHSPHFAIKRLTIAGNQKLSDRDIASLAKLHIGQSVFASSPGDVEQRLRKHPWLNSVTAVRELPDAFHLQVAEHRPLAVLELDELYILDQRGELFKRWEPIDDVTVPLVTGIEPRRFVRSRHFRKTCLDRLTHFLQAYGDARVYGNRRLQRVEFDDNDHLTLYVDGVDHYVRLGLPPYAPKLARLGRVIRRLRQQGKKPLYIDFDRQSHSNRVAVKLQGPHVTPGDS